MKKGIVLFAHGSRDPEWARPFEEIASRVRGSLPEAEVVVAFLESSKPALAEAVAALAGKDCTDIQIVPLFLGQGGHVKNDLPKLAAGAQAAHPRLKIVLQKPIGEQPAVIDAIAGAILEESA